MQFIIDLERSYKALQWPGNRSNSREKALMIGSLVSFEVIVAIKLIWLMILVVAMDLIMVLVVAMDLVMVLVVAMDLAMVLVIAMDLILSIFWLLILPLVNLCKCHF